MANKKNHLAEWRETSGLNMREAGEKFGINDSGFSKWEKVRVAASRCLEVSDITGIAAHLLRPDLYRPPSKSTKATSSKK